ncbi:MAG: FliO/MopB family protein [Acidobacteriaceae bacterium]|nr:FliO/MopB family protein [Acidobacteriaceae bacterium]
MMLQQVLALFFVLSLLAGALVLLRRKGFAQFAALPYRPGRREGDIKLLDRLPLGPQNSLVLVQVASERILIGVSPAGCTHIAGFGRDETDAARAEGECAG